MNQRNTWLLRRWRRMRAGVRDSYLLVRQFFQPLLFFLLTLLGGGTIYHFIARSTGALVGSQEWSEAVYQVLGLTFLQPLGDNLPHDFRLQLFYFLMPLVGLSFLAQGLADFGFLFFNRRARGKEWEMAVASTFNKHTVLIGLGHLGFRVVKALHDLGQDVVAIELDPDQELTRVTQALGIPVIADDGRRESVLEAAGAHKARAIIVCTQNDSLNLQIALTARRLNPDIHVVLRIFDDEFANSMQEQFGFRAMSATGMAAPKFAAAAAKMDITRPLTIEGEAFSMGRFDIRAGSKLIGRSMSDIEQGYDVSVVLLRQDGELDFHPAGERQLHGGEVVAVLGGTKQLSQLAADNLE